jgi:hypothetical protein
MIMAAPLGNQFWKARSKHGPTVMFANGDVLREAVDEYFQWVEDNPLYEHVVGWHKGEATHEQLPKMRAMTMTSLAIFLGISFKTLCEWRENRADLAPVIEYAEEIIKSQKFTGAAAGLLNANIISRDLGLKDNQSVDFNVPGFFIADAPEGEREPMPPIHGE